MIIPRLSRDLWTLAPLRKHYSKVASLRHMRMYLPRFNSFGTTARPITWRVQTFTSLQNTWRSSLNATFKSFAHKWAFIKLLLPLNLFPVLYIDLSYNIIERAPPTKGPVDAKKKPAALDEKSDNEEEAEDE